MTLLRVFWTEWSVFDLGRLIPRLESRCSAQLSLEATSPGISTIPKLASEATGRISEKVGGGLPLVAIADCPAALSFQFVRQSTKDAHQDHLHCCCFVRQGNWTADGWGSVQPNMLGFLISQIVGALKHVFECANNAFCAMLICTWDILYTGP